MTVKDRLVNRIGRRRWSDSDVAKYMGHYRSTWLTYAVADSLRTSSASGGSTTAILESLLDAGAIQGAMVVHGWVDESGVLQAEFRIETTKEGIRAAQGSKYQAVRFGKRELKMIAEFDGKLGFTLLPCDATKLATARHRRPEIEARVGLVIALYCGHNSEPELARGVAEKLRPKGTKLTDFHYRSGHWRGILKARFDDGTEVVRHHNDFKNYYNLYFFSQEKCNHCFDHFGYDCDMSVGDIWTMAMKDHPIKHTAIVTRSPRADQALEEAISTGHIVAVATTVRDILDGQSRTLPFHYNVSARAKVGRLFGMKIVDTVNEPVRIRDFIVTFLIMSNQAFSRTRLGRAVVLRLPQPIVRAYLISLKALEQL